MRHTALTISIPTLAVLGVCCASALAQNSGPSSRLRILQAAEDPRMLAARQRIPAQPPILRGFIAPILNRPIVKPIAADPAAPPRWQTAAADVAKNLARDRLLPTLARVIHTADPATFASTDPQQLQLLAAAGLPIDLVACFPYEGARSAEAVVAAIARKLAEGRNIDALAAELGQVPFQFRASHPGFRVASEEGRSRIEMLRLQLPTAQYWRGPGDGSALDITAQCVRLWPQADFLVCTRADLVDTLLPRIDAWPLDRPHQLTLIATDWKMAQWTQDNAKAGTVPTADGRRVATLLPRYASRGEERTVFDPAESFAPEALRRADHVLVHSPLLFQGGNLLAVEDPRNSRRTLLIGEAEIVRNTALGLTRDQVLEAFRIEFDVDDCLVIPAVSFHLDFEVTIRASDRGLVAFVNDEQAASKIILDLAIEAAARAQRIAPHVAEDARQFLGAGEVEKAINLVARPLAAGADAQGRFPLSFANMFGAGETDSPAANLQRVMLAIDVLAAGRAAPAAEPAKTMLAAYVQSLQRRAQDRLQLHALLARQGWKVVPIPSTADETVSVNYLNGIHELGRYVMPVYGGFLAPLDAAARAAFERELGPSVRIDTIFCGESQRRLGALHCSASAYYTLGQ